MKKFLSKLPVMIVCLSLVVVGLAVYIYMLARPVSYGMTYTYSHVVAENETEIYGEPAGTKLEMNIKVLSDEKLVTDVLSGGEDGESVEAWIIRNKNKFILIPVTMEQEEYDALITQLKEDPDEWNAIWNGEGEGMPLFDVNAFTIKANFGEVNMDMKCSGAIIFASVFGAFELVLIAFAVVTVVFYVKSKNNNNPAETFKTENA